MHETGVENIVINFDEEGNRVDWVWEGYSLDLKTNKDELASAEAELHGFIMDLNNLPTDDSDESIATIKAFYEKWFDMDFFLKTYAINILCGMDDDYWGNANNFYLYFDTGKKGTGKLYFIPFDYDNTLGCSIHEGGFKQNPLEWGRGENRPLMDRMLLVPEFKQKFVDYLLEVSAEDSYWNFERCSQQFLYWKTMLEPYANSSDLDWHLGDRYFGDWPWQPSGYSLINESNNIFDATRDAIVRNLNGENVNKILSLSEVECYEGIKVVASYVPEGVAIRKVFINGKQIAETASLYGASDVAVKNPEFFYPYVSAGKSYAIYFEYFDDKWTPLKKSSEVTITAKGGKGDLIIKNGPINYTFKDNVLEIFPEPEFYVDSEALLPDQTYIELNTIEWNYITTLFDCLTVDFNDTSILPEDRKNDDITFSYVAKFNMEDETNGSYRYIVLDYGSPYGNSY